MAEVKPPDIPVTVKSLTPYKPVAASMLLYWRFEIEIDPVVLQKMTYLIHYMKNHECQWFFGVDRHVNENTRCVTYIIHNIYIPKQEVSAAYVESSGQAMITLMLEVKAKYGLYTYNPTDKSYSRNPDAVLTEEQSNTLAKELSSIRMWCHSHVQMGVSPSGTDNTQWQEWCQGTPSDSFAIMGIFNQKGECYIRFRDFKFDVSGENPPMVILTPTLFDEQEFTRTITSRVTTRVYQPPSTPAYGTYTYEKKDVPTQAAGVGISTTTNKKSEAFLLCFATPLFMGGYNFVKALEDLAESGLQSASYPKIKRFISIFSSSLNNMGYTIIYSYLSGIVKKSDIEEWCKTVNGPLKSFHYGKEYTIDDIINALIKNPKIETLQIAVESAMTYKMSDNLAAKGFKSHMEKAFLAYQDEIKTQKTEQPQLPAVVSSVTDTSSVPVQQVLIEDPFAGLTIDDDARDILIGVSNV